MGSGAAVGLRSRAARLVLLACVTWGTWVAGSGQLWAQSAATRGRQAAATAVASESDGVPVYYRGRQIFVVRSGIGAMSAAERAADIQAQLDAHLGTDVSADDFRTVEQQGYTEVYLGDALLGVVTDQDAESVGVSRQLLAARALTQLKLVVSQTREEFTREAIVRGIGLVVVITLLFLLALAAGSFAHRRLRSTIDRWRGRKLKGIRFHRVQLLTAERQVAMLATLANTAYTVFFLLAVVIWLESAMASLPWTRPYSRLVVAYLSAPLSYAAQAFFHNLPSLFFLAVIAALTFGLLKVVHLFFREVERGTIRLPNFETEWAEPTYKIVRVLLIALAFVAAFPYIPGSSSPAFQGISLFFGLLVSLSSSSAISNIIAGTILTYTGAFRLGDRVEIGDTMGDVVGKSLLVTQVRTAKKVVVSIPNSIVLGGRILNFSTMARGRGVILHSTVTIGYDAPWRTVHELLIAAAKATDGIVSDPPPFVLQTALNDFYVSYEINAYTREPVRMAQIYSGLHANIQDAFNKAGVEIMSPHYGALRDGNPTTIPADHLPSDYRAPGFRVDRLETGDEAKQDR